MSTGEQYVDRVASPAATISKIARVLLFVDDATHIDDDRYDLPPDVTDHLVRAARLDPDVMKMLKRKLKEQLKNNHEQLSKALDDLDLLPRVDVGVRVAK